MFSLVVRISAANIFYCNSQLVDTVPAMCAYSPYRKSFQSLEQLSADMSLSQTLSLEARPTGTQWPHQGTVRFPSQADIAVPEDANAYHACYLIQVKRTHHL